MEGKKTYWSENLRLIFICLAIWFVVSFGFGLILVEPFWFAQQGSIYTFVALIFWYSKKMNELDKKYSVEES